jgi:hypothetical protein
MMAGTVVIRLYGIRYKQSKRTVVKKHHEEEEDEGAWWPLVRLSDKLVAYTSLTKSPFLHEQIAAMLISCATGVVLEKSVSRYEGFALLGVTMTGICGSLGAI